MLRSLRVAWAAPWSLIGLLLSPFFGSRRVVRGVLLCEGAGWPKRLGWNYRAITFGHVILCVNTADATLLDHEMVHVRQYERWGLLFIPAYLVASLGAKFRGGRAYSDNRFEVAARSTDDVGGRR